MKRLWNMMCMCICMVVTMGAISYAGQIESNTQKPMVLESVTSGVNEELMTQFLNGDAEEITIPVNTTFTIGTEGEVALGKIELRFANGEAPNKIKMYATDFNGQVNYETLAYISNNTTADHIFSYDGSRSAYITFEFEGESEKSCTLQGLSVYGDYNYPKSMEQGLGVTVLDAKDSRNPLSIYRIPIGKNIYRMAGEILENVSGQTDHEKILLFMNVVRDYRVGASRTLEGIIKDRIGACGDRSSVLAALAATQGLETRILSLANYPKGTGHAVVEIKVNGKWAVYDPSFGSFYTTTPENKRSPYVLSLKELRAGKGRLASCIVGFPELLVSNVSYGFLGPDIYEKANPIVVMGVDKMSYYPLEIDYNGDREITYDEFGSIYQGASYIGVGPANNFHIWTIKNLKSEKVYSFKIRGTFIGGEVADPNFGVYAVLDKGKILEGSNFTFNMQEGKSEWVIRFKPKTETVKLTLSPHYLGSDWYYINIDRFCIE
ncbi:transglutaminase-like domain-containing protein [Anaerovorax sp. IOR16]|uniref:transglutaminase-like domain-containing protein n=1 Tax=Anaerovorax sp. IOR16 TaxID=2773458 RepID=UPI0019D1FB7D|nr:transglutaminase-like domain-containing protein [Anaerovorax sp. IOR16]